MTNILTKEFTLGDVLSITTERLVSERHMEGVYDILNWMTGDTLFTHQLPRAAEACKPVLAARFPQLDPESNPELKSEVETLVKLIESAEGKEKREAVLSDWLERLKAAYGNAFNVVPLRDWESKDPMAEAVEMFGADKVIGVSVESPEVL